MENNIYSRIIEERNVLKKIDPVGFQLEALSQILTIVFTNDDTLPKTYTLENVLISEYNLKAMLKRLEIDADVTILNCSFGASYRVVQSN